MRCDGNGYEEVVGGRKWRSCGVARSIIVGFHPADPGSNPGTSILTQIARSNAFILLKKRLKSYPATPFSVSKRGIAFLANDIFSIMLETRTSIIDF